MIVKLLSKHHLELLSLKAVEAHPILHMSKYHIVGNYVSRLNFLLLFVLLKLG